MSPGPDLVPNTFFTRGDGHALMVQLPGPGADLLYDPTNGTISVGDLIALSKGGLQN